MTATPPTPPKKRTRKLPPKHDDKLELILRQAARLFSERGYATTSLDDVADALEMHKATLYHYISGKEEILYRCLIRS
ncbi:helix-turn-helix domain-containing protein, partial [Acinetobacter baumannii]